MNHDLAKLTYACCDLCRTVGHFIAEQVGKVSEKAVETKSMNSLVSYVDKEAERRLVEGLSRLLPEAVFLTEEDTVTNQEGNYRWIIDPLDGTTNFLYQLPIFAISLALEIEGELQLGVVFEVNNQECFYAWKGGGAWLNDRPIQVSQRAKLEDCIIATGFPYYDFERLPGYLKALSTFMRGSRGIRRLGSAAVDLAYVAAGRFDAFFEYSLHPWDVAGGILLIEEAGGLVSDFHGGNTHLHGKEIIAASPGVYREVLSIIQADF